MNDDLKKLFTLMTTVKFKVPSFAASSRENNLNNAKIQEIEIISQLNTLILNNKLNLKAVHVNDEKLTGVKYSTLLDLVDGDIYIYATNNGNIIGKPLAYIDVKVAFISKYKNIVSTITRRSFNNFANKENHYYWCFNENGQISVLIDTIPFYMCATKTNPWMISKKPGCSNDRNEDYIKGIWILNMQKFFKICI